MRTRNRKRSGVTAVGAGLLLTLAGCAVGPDYVRPELATHVPEAFVASTATDSIPPDLNRWWAAFGDATLNRLVDQALRDNQDLKLASARVLEARAALGGAQSDRWPSIEVGGTASRSKSSLATFGGQGSAYRNYFDANLTASYELDLWGRLSRAEESARATLLQSEMNRRTVTQTLVADVVGLLDHLGVAPGASPLDYAELLVNDLGEAAISLRPAIGEALSALRHAGAEHALVTGSGPTAVGLFRDIAKADAGASALPYAYSSAIVTSPASLA